MKNTNFLHSDVTRQVLKSFFNVYNTLGYGFLEKVYEKALFIELKTLNLFVERQVPIEVFYRGNKVGLYYADIIVNNCVIIEVKSAENLIKEHEAQLVNYLRATNIEVGLLLNFGKEPQQARKVLTSEYKRPKQP